MPDPVRLDTRVRTGADPDAVYDAFTGWVADQGLDLYPHQDEAVIELLGGNHVVLATPTGSGKSMVAIGAHVAALARDEVSFYTAPIKALVSEKFFALIEVFGADNVGMLTGDAAVNPDAPIICCTAEVLANIALREGRSADVGLVVMDEFHFYSEHDRGWAWQVPLLELVDAQFLLMSATLGDVSFFVEDLKRRTGRDTAVVDDAERPVPLSFRWSMEPLDDTLEELVTTGQDPVYVVHFTQAAAVEHATNLLKSRLGSSGGGPKVDKEAIAAKIGAFRFGAGFGKTLSRLVRSGIGVHHAGMLPKYRRLVETLAQAGLLRVICGTDTLGVGINVPIRTVLFTGLAKFDGTKQRVLRTREFQQIAGRAGRAGYDTAGYVVVQAPELRDRERAGEGQDRRAPGRGQEEVQGPAQEGARGHRRVDRADLRQARRRGAGAADQSRMKVDNAMLVNVVTREEDAFAVMRRLVTDNHEERRGQLRLARRALRLTRSLVRTGIVTRLPEVDEFGRRFVLTVDLPDDFALNQPLAHFALAAFDVLDPEAETYGLDVVSIVEAVLEAPRQILMAQQHAARGRCDRRDEGRRHRVRRADGAAGGDHLAAAAARAPRGALRDLPADPPVAPRRRAVAEVDRARDVGAGDGVHRLRRPLPARPLRGPGAALPHRRLPDAAQPVPESTARPRSRTSSSGWGRRCARPTPRCSTSGRRCRTPTTPPARSRTTSRRPRRVRCRSQERPFRGDAAQRDVGARGRRRRATTSTCWYASSARPPTAPTRRGRSSWAARCGTRRWRTTTPSTTAS